MTVDDATRAQIEAADGRGAGGGPGGMLGNFGKSRHRVQTKDTVNITFKDVAGVQEAKEEVQELVIVEGPGGCAGARELFLGEDADGPAFVVTRDAVHLVDGYVALLAQVRLRLD